MHLCVRLLFVVLIKWTSCVCIYYYVVKKITYTALGCAFIISWILLLPLLLVLADGKNSCAEYTFLEISKMYSNHNYSNWQIVEIGNKRVNIMYNLSEITWYIFLINSVTHIFLIFYMFFLFINLFWCNNKTLYVHVFPKLRFYHILKIDLSK